MKQSMNQRVRLDYLPLIWENIIVREDASHLVYRKIVKYMDAHFIDTIYACSYNMLETGVQISYDSPVRI